MDIQRKSWALKNIDLCNRLSAQLILSVQLIYLYVFICMCVFIYIIYI